jgi:hypothetical protein
MNKSKLTDEARTLIQNFAETHIMNFDGGPSIVPCTAVLAIEAFGMAAAMYANETGCTIDEAIEEYLRAMKSSGGNVAKACHKFSEVIKAEVRAERTVAKIIEAIKK